MNAIAALAAATLGTFVLRQVSVRVLADRQLPPAVGVTLRHAALAVMAGLVMSASPSAGRWGMPTVAAAVGVVTTVVAVRRTGNLAASIALGVTAYAVAGAIVPAV